MSEGGAICVGCASEKDVALARCGVCGLQPAGEERELALLCSDEVLTPSELRAVQQRIRRGEALRPSDALLARARAALYGEPLRQLQARELGALAVANLLLTPMLGWAVWFRYREEPAGRQALLVTAPVSALMLLGLGLWRYVVHMR